MKGSIHQRSSRETLWSNPWRLNAQEEEYKCYNENFLTWAREIPWEMAVISKALVSYAPGLSSAVILTLSSVMPLWPASFNAPQCAEPQLLHLCCSSHQEAFFNSYQRSSASTAPLLSCPAGESYLCFTLLPGDGWYYKCNSSALTWALKVRQLDPGRNMSDLGMRLWDVRR